MDQNFLVTDNRGKAKNGTAASREMTDDDLELLKAQAAADDSNSPTSGKRPVLTAFVVTVDYDGAVTAASGFDLLDNVDVGRPANLADMYAAAAHIQKDIQCAEVAQRTLHGLQQHAAQAAQAMHAAQLQQQMRHPR